MTGDDTTQAVLRALLSDHVGQENAVTQSQLAEATGINPSTLRSELRRLRDEREIPIGNLREGYFVIANEEEKREFVGHINSEIQSKRRTIEATVEAFGDFDPDDIDVSGSDDSDDEPKEQTYLCSFDGCDREITRDQARWPKKGPYKDQVVCPTHHGDLVRRGKA